MSQITAHSSIADASTTETCKSIVVKISQHLLAIPVNAVFKVIRSSLTYGSSMLGENRLIHIEEQTLPLIDLRSLLATVKPDNSLQGALNKTTETETFFVLAKSDSGKLVALVVDEPPVLMDLPLSQIYALPASQQQSIGNIASHMAISTRQNQHLSVMLLDLQQALLATGFKPDFGNEVVSDVSIILD